MKVNRLWKLVLPDYLFVALILTPLGIRWGSSWKEQQEIERRFRQKLEDRQWRHRRSLEDLQRAFEDDLERLVEERERAMEAASE